MLVQQVKTFEEWRAAARAHLAAGRAPAAIEWGDTETLRQTAGVALRPDAPPAAARAASPEGAARVSSTLLKLLETLAVFRTGGRWELMYRLLWRSVHDNPRLLEDAADPDVQRATLMERAVRRDEHKMHAFVRFREVPGSSGEPAYFAWFEPEHEILRRGAVFFAQRFRNMRWTIATPDGAAAWDGAALSFIDSPAPADRPQDDAQEELWRTYYRSICNVARINPQAMQREMPQRYWRHLPEAREIELLIRDGAAALQNASRTADDEHEPVPTAIARSLAKLGAPPGEDSAATCRRCELWKHATQAVTGEGAAGARIMLVGEQPGDEEDLRGRPFVGPAGRVLDAAPDAAGLERNALFITNAVKHFKWEPRGKRRLHKKPGVAEINACNIWLLQEITQRQPRVIVALGASALRALTGKTTSVEASRHDELRHESGARIVATYHPSAILRAEGERGELLRANLIDDLKSAARLAD